MILLHKWDSALWCVFQSCNCWEWIASYWEALLRIWCWLKVNILSFTESRLGTRLQKPYLITAVPNELQSCTRCILTVWMQMFAASVVAGSQSAATFSETVGEVFSSEHIHFKDNITAQPGIKDSVTQLKISDKKTTFPSNLRFNSIRLIHTQWKTDGSFSDLPILSVYTTQTFPEWAAQASL